MTQTLTYQRMGPAARDQAHTLCAIPDEQPD
jgi:hypothetical protein